MPSEAYPLSSSQRRLWFLDQLSPGLPHYSVPLVFDIEGEVDLEILRRCFDELVRRHETLRTVFDMVDGVPRQHILPHHPLDIPVLDLSHLSADERSGTLDPLIEREVQAPFDLSAGPIMRAVVVRLTATHYVLIFTVHHIAVDAWSFGIIFREFAALYEAFSAGRPSPLADLTMRYVDFALQQQAWMDSDASVRQLSYWRHQLRAPRPELMWATDRPRPEVPTHKGHRVEGMLSASTVEALHQLSRRENVTPFMTFVAAYAALLHRLTGQDDVIIGTPIANRTRQELEPLVGFFLNSLALRIDLSGHPTFRELLARTRRVAIDAYANQDLPFDRLVEDLNPHRSLGETPLAQTFLVLDGPHAGSHVIAVGEVIMRRRFAWTGAAKFDVALAIRRATTGRRVVADVSADVFDREFAGHLVAQFSHLLDHLADHIDERVDRLSIASVQDRRALVESWNRTAAPVPEGSLIDLFTAQVRLNPDSDAVLWRDQRVSYTDLQSKASRFASELKRRGVGPGDRVGLCMDRTPELIASALAVLMIGAAYVPLDPLYPAARLRFIASDAGCRVVMTQESWRHVAADLGGEPLLIDRVEDAPPVDAGHHAATPTSLAYVIYTSGSTGTPKGVAIEHRQVVNLVAWAIATFAADERAGMLASTSMSFDLSVFEWFVPLCSGGTVILVENLLVLSESPIKGRVTFVNSVPSVVRGLLRTGDLPRSVSVVAMAGEPLSQSLVRLVYEQPSVKKVFDLYGPTETTVYATCALRSADGPETIGRPIANTTALVLDEQQALTPVGVAGELFIGGAGVGRGYLGRDDLTRERFVVDPAVDLACGRMYRTGDRVRWRADGTLEFLGRLDRQVKLRGFRIELGEIEAALRSHEAIADAVVVKLEADQPDRAQLVAFIVLRVACDNDALYAHLEARLPHFMLPTRFDRVDALPRLPNGKIDVKALEGTTKAPLAERVLAPPRTATEATICDIWSHLFERTDIGVDDHFFRIGGHSLLATQLIVRLNRHFGASLDLATAFTAPTIAQQARLIDHLGEPRSVPLESPSVDQRQMLEWAGVGAPYPRESSVCRLIEEQATQTPEAMAIATADRSLTYAELNAQGNQLAHHLLERLSQAESSGPLTVGILLPRSIDAVVAMLAVLKAGGAYVPLDPTLPALRLAALAQRARVRCVIVSGNTTEQFGEIPLIDLETEHAVIAAAPPTNPGVAPSADAIAYVLFTSGSTGDPKAVGVPHRAIVRLAHGMPEVHLDPDDTVAHLASLSFDASTFEIWCPLLRGASLALLSADVVTAPSLRAFLTSHHVTTMLLTTSLFNAIVDEDATVFRSVRQLVIGGEALSVVHVRRALTAVPTLHLINGYGPTEATTMACLHPIEPKAVDGASSIPIGRPLLNTRVYVLDADRQFVPVGRDGELWIGGDALAVGYLDDPELTSERFVKDPFADSPGARMYRSGDRARWRADGILEFVGRLDDQIKLRGHRIEPGEIEAALGQHPAVQRSAVVAIDRPAIGRTLVAFVVFAPGFDLPERDELLRHGLRDALRSRLPEYMVPSEWSALDVLPLLSSGKADRRALVVKALARAPKSDATSWTSLSAVDARIEEIWATLLGTSSIKPDDNFFDLGGHSLLAMQVVSRIQAAFNVDFDLRMFFRAPTIAATTATVERLMTGQRSTPAPMARARRLENVPLSYAQQRIWFLQRWFGDVGVYNVPSALKLEGVLNLESLRHALQAIVNRHESLRTVFPLIDGVPVQQVIEALPLPFEVIDLSHLDSVDAESAARVAITEHGKRPFDLETGPLIRATVLRLAPTTTVLALTLHHIVSDGWSMVVLFRELAALYRASGGPPTELPPLPLQYADFAVWQRDHVINSSALEQQLTYWREQLRSPIGQIDWPIDRPRPDTTTANGDRIVVELPVELSRDLANFASAQGATLFMTMLAAFQGLLHRYTGQHDVLIGTPVANRTRPEIEGLIGCFINTLVMRANLSGDLAFRQILATARQTAIDAQTYQDLPFELMIDALGVKRSASHSPLFQAMLVVNDGLAPVFALEGLTVSRFPFRFDYAKFDVTLDLWTNAGRVRGSLEYNADLFSAAFAQQMVEDFVAFIRHVVAHPDQPISEIPLRAVRDGASPAAPPTVAPAMEPDNADHPDAIALEERLLPLWRRVLDLPAIGRTDNFFELGGNSLKAVQLFAEIERDFGVRMPLSSLFRNGTIRAQAALLAARLDGPKPWSVLVPLQPHGSRPPLFLVHGIGGEVLSFEALTRHLDDQPVFGLQAEYESAGDDHLEAVASRYIAAMRAQLPSGPYLLGGYSSGGVVAYEMAQQLVAAGEAVALLAMVDASAPKVAAEAVTPQTLWRLVKNAAYWTLDDEFLRSDWANRRARVSSKLRAIRARHQHKGRGAALDAGADVRDLLGLWKVPPHARRFLERYVRMMVAYRPRPYPGTVSLLRARTLSLTYLGAEDFGWGQLADRVVVHHVPGAHDTILKEPRVRDLAAALTKQLRDSLVVNGTIDCQ